ncbi:NYN domain-containing protein [Patescibacteria group bacterium]|nr:NYN domain-containing protein [Patescibacteria group bacterium]MBU4023199.1 NYN domain-containing protein [Patescibacteria group bacterium]
MEQVNIFIDGSNFYHLILKKIDIKEPNFDFEKFVKFLSRDRQVAEKGKYFYTGTVREKDKRHETKKAMSNQNILFSKLISTGGWNIRTSKLRTRLERIKIDDRVENFEELTRLGIEEIVYQRSREKGIDVMIAVDIINGALNNNYDTAILVSSDTDLVPAIDFVRNNYNKRIEYIGFSMPKTEKFEETRPTKRLIYATDIQRVLVASDIKNFVFD